MNTPPRTALAAGLVLAATPLASAQVATSLVEVGDTVVANGVTTVGELLEFNVNPLGGYAVLSGNDAGDATEQEFLLGNVAPLTAVVLATEGARGGFTIDDFVSAPTSPTTAPSVSARAPPAATGSAVPTAATQPSRFAAIRCRPPPASAAAYRVPARVQITADGGEISFTSSIDGAGIRPMHSSRTTGQRSTEVLRSASGGIRGR